ncbi:single-stranded DNA-binding protein [Nocardiopsis suaedae]|uniref:Single-stranded DNA-binding protein n=1 Tax=Nocardiopsis suaedae TaxID=3018444 RepID=A0ABT4TVR8_9ACTN|nr:single-stranded DNA-binding protein [Nocardiopsis suaedae]MDA2808793.1 single-stranded DNA-binding protein [Nocardiopsis suaedae]
MPSTAAAPAAVNAPPARRAPAHRNEVVLAGRVTAEPSVRELPSGEHLVSWRISVARPPSDLRRGPQADPFTCVSFRPDIREAVRGWRIGDLVQVSGALRRRYRRAARGGGGTVEVEATGVRALGTGEEGGADPTGRTPDRP